MEKIKKLLRRFEEFKSTKIPAGDDVCGEFKNEIFLLEMKDIIYSGPGTLQLRSLGKRNLHGLLAHEGDLDSYKFV